MKSLYSVFLVIGFWSCFLESQAQVSQGGLPLSSQNPELLKSVLVYETMPMLEIDRLKAEDAINDLNKEVPWRFGENIDVNYSLSNSGIWDVFPKGDRVWRLGIQSTGALTINLTFNSYHLPPGAKLFVYNADKSEIIGAFTDFNNQGNGVFATTLVSGDHIVIEYYEPVNPEFPGELNLTRVTHGYRNAFDFAKSFGTSGSCNNNVNCPEAAGWENQIRSVCMLVSGGNGFCTGAVVNNTSQNGVPYVLTANHCYSDPTSWVFWFNWQSPTCTNPGSSPSYNSLSGATLKAKYADSDFCLVQMSSTPPQSYNAYYAGWNREDVGATSGAGIHHPDGDIKKISYSTAAYISSNYMGSGVADSHWHVYWNDGVTEPGSSGSPIFDQNHRIVGQLHGGPSSCTASDKSDYYGKFSMSWNQGTTSATRLKDWLDPTNIAGLILDGYDPNATTDPPVANFIADNTSPGVNSQVNFSDLSSNNPTSWNWSFSPSTITYLNGTSSASKNPQVSFQAVGAYSVSLTATNAYGSGSTTKTNYINAINCTINTLPFTENFTSGILPSCWTQVDHQGNGQIWQFGAITGQSPNPALAGNYAYLNSDAYGSGNTQNADLVTPTLNLSGYSSVTLQFNHYFLSYSGSSGTLSYSINNGSTWTQIQQFTTTSTVNPTAFSQVIAALSGQSQVKFKWNYTGTWGYYWAIDDVQITGVSSGSTLTVTPSNQNVTAASGSTSFTVTSNSSWVVSSSQIWCTVTPSGTGNGTITANYTQNTTSASRTANITVTVTGLTPVVVTVTQAAPTLLVSPANQNVSDAPGSTTFTVTSNSAWTASSDQPWCIVTAAGSGNGTITANYTQNPTFSSRVAVITVTVSGLTPIAVTVTQTAIVPTLVVTPSNQSVTSSAGNTSFSVTSNSNWTAVSDQAWCSVTSSGTGNGILTANYTQNTLTSSRVANITVTVSGLSPVIVTVTQDAAAPADFLYTMANDVQTSDYTFEFDLLLLDNEPTQPFELATVQAGIFVNPAIYNGGTVTASIVPGTSTLNASQQPSSVAFTQSTNILKLASKAPPGAGNGTIISTNPASPNRICRLKLTNSLPWATAQPDLTFNFNNTPYATKISQYIGGINTALTVNTTNCYSVCVNNLLNPPPTLLVTPSNQTVTSAAGSTSFAVSANRGWAAGSDQGWCTINTSGYGNGTITASFTANTTSISRVANITVTVTGLSPVTVTVTQNGEVNKTLNLSLFLEGLYNGSGLMHPAMDESGPHWGATIADKITIEFHDAGNYANLLYTASNVNLNTDGTASLTFPATFSGSYYVTIIHRNSIETVTAAPISFSGSTTNYSFDNASKAFGGNMLYKGDGTWVIYGGDPNQDGLVDASDMVMIDNDATNFVTGYINNDVNGDGLIDAGDMILLDNNSSAFVAKVTP